MTEDAPEEKIYPFPKYVGLILGNEFCERYSFYGLRAVLVLYLSYFIGYDENTATVIYHAFTVLAYLFPLLGGAIADGYWGKFKTILWLSLLYGVGMIINAISAIPFGDAENGEVRSANGVLCIIGLFIIAIGTGGIKPCVSSFGADQFEKDDVRNTTIFFDLFYWAVNAGSLISTFVSPNLRRTTCGSLGTEDSCYFLAFAIPAVLMAVAICLFLIGNKFYKKVPASGFNIFWEVVKCLFYGAVRKIPADSPVQDHWLYGAYGKVDDWIIRDSKYLVRVLVMFAPLPIFWAAFDQQGSRWTLQAVRMNGFIFNTKLFILPDEAQILNAFFILAFIPIFNQIYVLVDRCFGANTVTKLRKVSTGMVFAAIAYCVSALVQSQIDVELTKSPEMDYEMTLSVLNVASADFTGRFGCAEENYLPNILEPDVTEFMNVPRGEKTKTLNNDYTQEIIIKTNEEANFFTWNYSIDEYDGINHDIKKYETSFEVDEGRVVWNMAVFDDGNYVSYPGWASKDVDGKAHITVVSGLDLETYVEFVHLEDEEDQVGNSEDSGNVIKFVGVCDFTESYEDEIPCIDGQVHDSNSAITLEQGDYRLVSNIKQMNQKMFQMPVKISTFRGPSGSEVNFEFRFECSSKSRYFYRY